MATGKKNMSQKRYLQIVGFDQQLHYKDKNPIWIKLYCSLLDDYEFAQISDQNKFHAIGLMILAARLNNRLPDDELWLRKQINANQKINVKLLLEIGFLEVIKGARKKKKNSFNGGNSLETLGNVSSAVLENSENSSSIEQNRTEEKRKEENITDTEQNENARVSVSDLNLFSEVSENNPNLPNAGELKQIVKKDSSDSGSQFSLDECRKYVEKEIEDGATIQNPSALAMKLFNTGQADSFIMQKLYPKEFEKKTFGEPRQFSSDEPCAVCFGAKLADADGKGFRPCENCKNEKGISTGWQPL